jgi:hypothetical protein
MLTRAAFAALATLVVTAVSFTPLGGEAAIGGTIVVDTIPRDPALLGELARVATPGTPGRVDWLADVEPRVASRGSNQSRALVTFDIGGIPSGATIVSAMLTLDECAATPGVGHVVVDHLTPVTAPGASTFDVEPLGVVGSFGADGPIGARRVSVTAAVTTDFAALETLTQYRLRLDAPDGAVTFRGDADGECSAAAAGSPEGASDAAPMLVVTYRR